MTKKHKQIEFKKLVLFSVIFLLTVRILCVVSGLSNNKSYEQLDKLEEEYPNENNKESNFSFNISFLNITLEEEGSVYNLLERLNDSYLKKLKSVVIIKDEEMYKLCSIEANLSDCYGLNFNNGTIYVMYNSDKYIYKGDYYFKRTICHELLHNFYKNHSQIYHLGSKLVCFNNVSEEDIKEELNGYVVN